MVWEGLVLVGGKYPMIALLIPAEGDDNQVWQAYILPENVPTGIFDWYINGTIIEFYETGEYIQFPSLKIVGQELTFDWRCEPRWMRSNSLDERLQPPPDFHEEEIRVYLDSRLVWSDRRNICPKGEQNHG